VFKKKTSNFLTMRPIYTGRGECVLFIKGRFRKHLPVWHT